MGLTGIGNIDLYGDEKGKEDNTGAETKKVKLPPDETVFILDKTCQCPLCDATFKSKIIKTGATKLISQDIDLRPRYADIDTLKYGVHVCPTCGYAAILRNFPTLSSVQGKLIKEKISSSFTGLGPEAKIYSYDDAIARHKLALVNSVIKRGKTSERAYICLLLAWLTRGKSETLPEDTPNIDEVRKELKAEELDLLEKARVGFVDAFSKESFPFCGLDEQTTIYLIAALAAETKKSDEALRWASRIILSKTANDRIKEKARNLKEMITANKF